MNGKISGVVIAVLSVVVLLVLGGSFFLPWNVLSWGRLQIAPVQTVTVVGEAKSEQKTQIGLFTAGVNAYNDDKQTAVNEVNGKVEAIIEAAKQFGVKTDDIKTQSVNIYQNQEQFYEDGRQKFRPGQWNVGNTVEIKLRDVDRAAALASLLGKSGATNVNGPNFSLDDTSLQGTALFDAAIANAKEKAQSVAKASGRKLGNVVSVTEGYTPQPVYAMYGAGGGGGGGIAPGTGTVMKTVTVTYELE